MYVLKQATKKWYDRLKNFILGEYFRQKENECFFC